MGFPDSVRYLDKLDTCRLPIGFTSFVSLTDMRIFHMSHPQVAIVVRPAGCVLGGVLGIAECFKFRLGHGRHR